MNIEHQEICKAGAALIDAELRKPTFDRVTVYAVHSSPGTGPGRITVDFPKDAPEGFTVITPGGGSDDWRSVNYSAIFTRLVNATRQAPILSH